MHGGSKLQTGWALQLRYDDKTEICIRRFMVDSNYYNETCLMSMAYAAYTNNEMTFSKFEVLMI